MAEKPWASMTSEEKRAARIERWRNPDIPFVNPKAETDYRARVNRIVAAINLEKPDRVPINLDTGFWPADRAGLTPYDAMHDSEAAAGAWFDFMVEFQPDTIVSPLLVTTPASVFEYLDYRLYSWPGRGVPRDAGFQYNDKEWMLPHEYDHLISDPTDFMLRTYLPRTVGAFAGFAGLSSLLDFIELPFVSGNVAAWGSAEMAAGLENLAAAAREVGSWSRVMMSEFDRLMRMGFPAYIGGGTKAPFDILGDTLRGTKGVILDMFRRPDKVLAACERLVPVAIDWALRRPGRLSTPLVLMPLHKGADGFMSDEQFQRFYWPTLRAVILGLIDEGVTPILFAEGRYGSRLEAIMDLPRGKTVWLFDQTDMAHAKKTIGQVACIQGNVPLSLIHAGSPEAMIDYTRMLIDTAGDGGGFILDIGAVADEGKDENLHAMIRTARDHGVY